MTSRELARLLLTLPDLPVATHAHNHTYMSHTDRQSHGPLKVGLLHTYDGDHIVVGDISRRMINEPNWYVKEMYYGEAPNNWNMPTEWGGWDFSKSAKSYGGPTKEKDEPWSAF